MKAPNPVREFLDKHDILVREFAIRVDVTEQAIRFWLSGAATPTERSMRKLASAMKTSREELTQRWDAWKRAEAGIRFKGKDVKKKKKAKKTKARAR